MIAYQPLNYKMRRMGRRRWVLFGGLAALAGTLLLVISINSGLWKYPPVSSLRGGWIYEFQGLLGGILALCGALFTVVYLRRQLIHARDASREASRTANTTSNRALLDRIRELSQNAASLAEATADAAQARRKILESDLLGMTMNPELERIRTLVASRDLLTFRAKEVDKAIAAKGIQQEVDSLVEGVDAASVEFRQANDHVYRLLSGGWTVTALSRRSATELAAMPDEPT